MEQALLAFNKTDAETFTAEAQRTQRAAENGKRKHILDFLSLPRFLCVLCASAVKFPH
jgi:hypothetical protein